MKKGVLIGVLVMLIVLGWLVKSRAAPLQPGDKAPDFTLADQNGTTIHLADFLGKKIVVLAFYIKAFTPG
jgi:cytochrome oxidase Cu insertion factor (SCO1/SenC/PrrC family)